MKIRHGLIACNLIAMLLTATVAHAVELRVHHSVIKKILAEQVFTDDGRKYVKASGKVYLCVPGKPGYPEEKGRLKIRARFSRRSARDLFGRCIGLGDSFLVAITAVPYYDSGLIRLKDVNVVGVMLDAKKIMEEQRDKAPYKQELVSFQVSRIRVTSGALVLTMDFVLDVK